MKRPIPNQLKKEMLAMSDLVQCTRCKKILMDEEYNLHRCIPEIKDFRTIKCASHYIIKDENGGIIIGVRTLNGISYEFLEVPEDKEHTKIPYQPTFDKEKNNRGFDNV